MQQFDPSRSKCLARLVRARLPVPLPAEQFVYRDLHLYNSKSGENPPKRKDRVRIRGVATEILQRGARDSRRARRALDREDNQRGGEQRHGQK